MTIGIGVVTFRLTLGTPHGIGPNLIRQPGGVALDRRAVLGTGCLLLLGPTPVTSSRRTAAVPMPKTLVTPGWHNGARRTVAWGPDATCSHGCLKIDNVVGGPVVGRSARGVER